MSDYTQEELETARKQKFAFLEYSNMRQVEREVIQMQAHINRLTTQLEQVRAEAQAEAEDKMYHHEDVEKIVDDAVRNAQADAFYAGYRARLYDTMEDEHTEEIDKAWTLFWDSVALKSK